MRLAQPDDWYSRQCELTLLRHEFTKPADPARAWQLVAQLDSIDPEEKARAAGHPYTAVYRRVLAATIEARAGNVTRAEAELARARRTAAGDSIMKLDMAPDEALLLSALGRTVEARKLMRNFSQLRPTQLPAMMRDPLYRTILDTAAAAPSTAPR